MVTNEQKKAVERLDKYLSDAEIGTRKEIKEYVRASLITINGETVHDPGIKIKSGIDVICFKGERVLPFSYTYILLNKPAGCVSATEDKREKTVIDVLKSKGLDKVPKDLSPVGRLDKDATGLLLLTNDGGFSHELLSPKKHVEKEYLVRVDTPLREDEIMLFKNGIELSDFTCMPSDLIILSEYEARVIIREGKYHQVKRMFKALQHTVLSLKRIRMGKYILPDDLLEGEYKRTEKIY